MCFLRNKKITSIFRYALTAIFIHLQINNMALKFLKINKSILKKYKAYKIKYLIAITLFKGS